MANSPLLFMHLKTILHALLFSSTEPLPTSELVRLVRLGAKEASQPELEKITEHDVTAALKELTHLEEENAEPALQLQETASGWRCMTNPATAPWVRLLQPEPKPARLTPAALETLAIIAYRQPVSRAEIESVRGVSVGGTLETLIDRNLVETTARADLPGRPLLYHTTPFFLEYLGLRNLDELPNVDELKRSLTPENDMHAVAS